MKKVRGLHKAFSMIELIFVIVLIGILASIGGNLLPDNRLLNDTNFIVMKIKETQKNAIGYNITGFDKDPWSSESNSTCITLSKAGFLDKEENPQKTHKFSIDDFDEGVLCFDEYGRPYIFDATEHKLLQNLDINVTYNGKKRKISVMPISGYVTLAIKI